MAVEVAPVESQLRLAGREDRLVPGEPSVGAWGGAWGEASTGACALDEARAEVGRAVPVRLGLGGHDEGGELAERLALLADVGDALVRVGVRVRVRAGVGVRVRVRASGGVRGWGEGCGQGLTSASSVASANISALSRLRRQSTCVGVGLLVASGTIAGGGGCCGGAPPPSGASGASGRGGAAGAAVSGTMASTGATYLEQKVVSE